MIFSEIYSAYYNAVAAIISAVKDGERSEKELQRIVSENAFCESVLTVLPSLKSGKWRLLRKDLSTPLKNKPTMPLTDLQKQWLKAISLDPRVKLFDVKFPDLDGVEPLFTADDYYIYDKYGDGDSFSDEKYIKHFRIILDAIRRSTPIKLELLTRNGKTRCVRCYPQRLEYSEKDDKFRLISTGWRTAQTVNLANIVSCEHYTGQTYLPSEIIEPVYDLIRVKICDQRNAMERFMLHFAHFEKKAEKIDNNHYSVEIKYPHCDESEIVIRILSFGPMVEVMEPDSFRKLIIEKLKKQLNCGLR